MGWNIGLIENTVEVSKDIAKALAQYDRGIQHGWSDADDVTLGMGKLYFNSDHMEHMDYLWDETVIRILCVYKVKGRICFGSLEGDNRGTFWGYEFDGEGNMHKLQGKVVYERKPVPEPVGPKQYCLVKSSRVYYGGPASIIDNSFESLESAIAYAKDSDNPVGYDVYLKVPRAAEAQHPVWEYHNRDSYQAAVDQIDPLHDGVV